MSLISSQTASRIDFTIAGLPHYVDADGVHFDFGGPDYFTDPGGLQAIVDAMNAVREWGRQFDIQPTGDAPGTPPNIPGIDKTVALFTDRQLMLRLAGQIIVYLDGSLAMFNTGPACIADSQQDISDLCDAIVKWAEDNFGVTPTAPESDD